LIRLPLSSTQEEVNINEYIHSYKFVVYINSVNILKKGSGRSEKQIIQLPSTHTTYTQDPMCRKALGIITNEHNHNNNIKDNISLKQN